MKTFILADTHFGHRNILLYEPCRLKAVWEKHYKDRSGFTEFAVDFQQLVENAKMGDLNSKAQVKKIVEQHDKILIDNWNSVISSEDIVWHLGDFAMGGVEQLEGYKKKLKGKINLILGNHDCKPASFYYRIGFNYVSKYPILLGGTTLLSHAPVERTTGDIFNYFGHVHSQADVPTKTEHSQCISIERQELKPIEINLI